MSVASRLFLIWCPMLHDCCWFDV